jgi:hypothetical protein
VGGFYAGDEGGRAIVDLEQNDRDFTEESVGEGAPTFYAIHSCRPCNTESSTPFIHLKFQGGADGPDGGNINGVSDAA